jgi:hypothetical protein
MKYMLLMYSNEAQSAQIPPAELEGVQKDWYRLMQEAAAAGVLLDNNGFLSTNDATTVRVREGKTLTIDGPFAETHEQLGGYFLVDCKDLDEAVTWAAKIPTAKYGSIEVRPLWTGNAG